MKHILFRNFININNILCTRISESRNVQNIKIYIIHLCNLNIWNVLLEMHYNNITFYKD